MEKQIFSLENKHNIVKYFLFIIGAILVYYMAVRNISNVYGPFLYPEEMGYWSNAAMFSGKDWSGALAGAHTWYSYGYSMILTPLFLLFDDMQTMYRVAIIINALLVVGIYCIANAIAKRFLNRDNEVYSILVAVVAALYPSYQFFSSIGGCEITLAFTIWLCYFFALKFEEEKRTIWLILLTGAVVYAYSCHNRALSVVVAYILLIVLMLICKQINKKQIFIILGILGIFLLFNIYMTDYLSGNLYSKYSNVGEMILNTNLSANDYLKTGSKLMNFLSSPYGLLSLLASALEKYWSMVSTSLGLVLFGFVYFISCLFKREKTYMFSKIFYGLSFIMAWGVSSVFMGEMFYGVSDRFDGVIYGRYTDNCIGIVILLGMVFILNNNVCNRLIILIISIMGLLYKVSYHLVDFQYAYRMSVYGGVKGVNEYRICSFPGLGFYTLFSPKFELATASVFVFIIVGVLICISLCNKKKLMNIMAIFIIAVFCYSANASTEMYTNRCQNIYQQGDFKEVLDGINDNAEVCVDISDIFTYYTLQNRKINSIVYNDIYNDIKNEEGLEYNYDYIVCSSTEYKEGDYPNYIVKLQNDTYVLLERN